MYMKHVLVIGGGKIGSAIGETIRNVGHSVEWWDRDPSRCTGMGSLEERVAVADIIFLCIHSWVIRETLERIRHVLRVETPVVVVAKGFEQGTGKTVDHVFSEVLPDHMFAFFGGPMVAPEIAQGKYAFGAIATSHDHVYQTMMSLVAGSRVRLQRIDDVRGAVLAGVLKNVYAIGLGMLDELGMGSNARGWYATKVVEEMGRIIEVCGGVRETAYSIAGMGDFIATGMSEDSRHRNEGRNIAKGEKPLVCEGVISAPVVVSLLGETDSFPLVYTIAQVVEGRLDSIVDILATS